MAKFRKKPVEINAWLIKDLHECALEDLPQPVKDGIAAETLTRTSYGGLLIRTLEGMMEGNVTDWLIRGVQGELYPCKPNIFARTYTAVDDDESPVDAPSTLLNDLLGVPGPASELVTRLTRELKQAQGEARAQAIRVDQAESEATELAKKISQLKTENNGLRRDIKRLEGQLERGRATAT